jgi:hypothetical protein
MKTKIYKLEVSVIDFERQSLADVIYSIEHNKYLSVKVIGHDVREVDWSDDYPLNKSTTSRETFRELFSDEGDQSQEEYNRALDHEVDFD